ncbi:MAG: hypothetical protein KAV45_15570 [Calditrichia bacterium]|nr:hypothetical protein [Calditrichia bacterium]
MSNEFIYLQPVFIILYWAAGIFAFAWMLYVGSKLGQILNTLQELKK